MTALVVDASVAIKWLVREEGSDNALCLLDAKLVAPDLLYAEAANILWKMVRRGQVSADEADQAAYALSQVEIQIVPARSLFASALRLSVQLDHPAYDCVYLAAADALAATFVTADAKLLRKLAGRLRFAALDSRRGRRPLRLPRTGRALTTVPPLPSVRAMSDAPQTAPLPRAWPFEEAAKLAARIDGTGKDVAVFETGYGPSGLPHIGTFGEVARTTWVRHAYTTLTGRPSRLIAFSDDMDGLRKVPDNVPHRDLLARHLGKPLTAIPDPFGTHESFGAHNNAHLRSFLDQFGFEYEFASSTEYYPIRPVRRGAAARARAASTKSSPSCCPRSGRSGVRPTRRSCRSIPRPGR